MQDQNNKQASRLPSPAPVPLLQLTIPEMVKQMGRKKMDLLEMRTGDSGERGFRVAHPRLNFSPQSPSQQHPLLPLQLPFDSPQQLTSQPQQHPRIMMAAPTPTTTHPLAAMITLCENCGAGPCHLRTCLGPHAPMEDIEDMILDPSTTTSPIFPMESPQHPSAVPQHHSAVPQHPSAAPQHPSAAPQHPFAAPQHAPAPSQPQPEHWQ